MRRPPPAVKRRPPPDWHSRTARWRLFVLVAALMTVLIAMNEARKPSAWSWLWRGRAEPEIAPVDTRLPPAPSRADEPVAVVTAPPSASAAPEGRALDALRGAWQQVWDSLESRQKIQLSRLLGAARRSESISAADVELWKPLVVALDDAWNQHFTAGNRDLLLPERELAKEQKQSALESLTEFEVAWTSRFLPALEAAADGNEWTEKQRAALAEMAVVIEELALGDVRDDTVWRPDDTSAWFRLVERLQAAPPQEISAQSRGHVSHVQIYRQPEEYRGELVSIEGTARLAYRVPAPRNDLGVKEYCLFWIQPADGSNRPVVVYALQPPHGFPPLARDQRKLHEPMEVTGYFFKRWVYRAADGLNSAPLLLAHTPTWLPPPPAERTMTEKLAERLGALFWPVVLGSATGLALLAVGIAWLASWSTRSSRKLQERTPGAEQEGPTAWEKLPATPSVEESLRNLERQEGAE